MRLSIAWAILFTTTVLLISTARCDDDEATDPKVAVDEDGTCDKDGCGSDEKAKYDAPPEKEDTKTDDVEEEEIIAEEEEKEEKKEKDDELPVTSCICTGTEEKPEVGVEVLFKPDNCGRRTPSNNDDVVTLHLRGYKASDMSEFITT